MLKQSLSDILSKYKINILIITGITAFLRNVLIVSTSPLAACFHPPDEVVQNKQPHRFASCYPIFQYFFLLFQNKIISSVYDAMEQLPRGKMVWTDEEKAFCVLTYNRTKWEVLTFSMFCKTTLIPVLINILTLDFDILSDKECFNMQQSFRAYVLYLRVLY